MSGSSLPHLPRRAAGSCMRRAMGDAAVSPGAADGPRTPRPRPRPSCGAAGDRRVSTGEHQRREVGRRGHNCRPRPARPPSSRGGERVVASFVTVSAGHRLVGGLSSVSAPQARSAVRRRPSCRQICQHRRGRWRLPHERSSRWRRSPRHTCRLFAHFLMKCRGDSVQRVGLLTRYEFLQLARSRPHTALQDLGSLGHAALGHRRVPNCRPPSRRCRWRASPSSASGAVPLASRVQLPRQQHGDGLLHHLGIGQGRKLGFLRRLAYRGALLPSDHSGRLRRWRAWATWPASAHRSCASGYGSTPAPLWSR